MPEREEKTKKGNQRLLYISKMPLLPSLKEKKRYVAFEVVSKEKFNFNQVKKSIEETLFKYIGLLGTSKAGMQVLPERYTQNKGLIRINHQFHHQFPPQRCALRQRNSSRSEPGHCPLHQAKARPFAPCSNWTIRR